MSELINAQPFAMHRLICLIFDSVFGGNDLPSYIHPDLPTSCKDGKTLQQLCAVH